MDKQSIQAMLREGIAAAKQAQQKSTPDEETSSRRIRRLNESGRTPRERAREILLQVVELDDQIIPAWLWLSTVMDRREEQRICLENVLMLEPENKYALAGLARLEQTPPEPEPPSIPPSAPVGNSKYTRLKPNSTAGMEPPYPLRAASKRTAGTAQQILAGSGCPFCQQPISAIDKNCPHCDLPLVMVCPACDTDADVEQPDCPVCGEAMGDCRQPVDYFSHLGETYQKKQQHQAAIKAWQSVEILQPDYPRLQVYMGEAHLGVGRPDRAWDSLQRALADDPDDAELHFALGELARQRGEREEAFKHYQRATQRAPQHGPAWFQLGQLYQQARRQKEATQAYRRAIKLLPAESPEYRQTQAQLERLSPGLPERMATGWSELIRQMIGPVTLCVLAILLDSGLRPWWISLGGWLALILAISGTFLYVSGTDLPRNPVMQAMVGERGLSSDDLKITLALVGAILWLLALMLILLPLGQSYPELPQL